MSDATSPPPRSSYAPADETAHENGSELSFLEGEYDTSLDQSYMSTAKEEASGDSEGRADNKQKRKRTSPKDQAILEAEYKQNPKPHKAARAEIVKKVDLNEKEVQIWFQNRRQINRRKSRPLLPHEIMAFGLGGMVALSSDPASMLPPNSSQNLEEPMSSSQQEQPGSQDRDETSSCQYEIDELRPEAAEEVLDFSKDEAVVLVVPEEKVSFPPTAKQEASSGIMNTEASSVSVTESVIKSFSSTPGYLANRWNNINSSFSTPPSSKLPPLITPPMFSPSQPASCPERIDESVFTQSSIRISLSLDGKAELVTSSPSPPHQHAPWPSSSPTSFSPQRRIGTLQRSQSALLFSRPSVRKALAPFPCLPTGRSKDARTWESCCDSEARDALTLQAENESSGSAIAAISLIRSTSNSALKPNANKRNVSTLKQDSSKQGKKPRLGRAMSSFARLQGSVKSSSKQEQETSGFCKDGLMRSPSGDSDKENWAPHEGGGNSRRRPLPSSRAGNQSNMRAVLGDNHNVISHAANLGGGRNRKRKAVNIAPSVYEDPDNAVDVPEEVEEFMRGEISPSKKGDLDCVQGLLSLSQGNWR